MEATMKRSLLISASVAVVVLATLTACGSDDDGGGTGDGAPPIEVTDAWGWSAMDDRGAVYFTVSNSGEEADALVGATSDASDTVEVHETTMSDGVAEMAPVESVEIAAGSETAFEPGGYHVMLLELPEPLEVGSSISVTLEFEQAGEITVDAKIREFVDDAMEEADEEM
jgi:copper(I)-binding protein